MQKSQAEKDPEGEHSDDRSKIERARDEMSPEVYAELVQRALELVTA